MAYCYGASWGGEELGTGKSLSINYCSDYQKLFFVSSSFVPKFRKRLYAMIGIFKELGMRLRGSPKKYLYRCCINVQLDYANICESAVFDRRYYGAVLEPSFGVAI